jgi:hypothetical protein
MYANVAETVALSRSMSGGLRAAETRSDYKARKPKADTEAAKFSKMFLTLTKPDRKIILDLLKSLSSKRSK